MVTERDVNEQAVTPSHTTLFFENIVNRHQPYGSGQRILTCTRAPQAGVIFQLVADRLNRFYHLPRTARVQDIAFALTLGSTRNVISELIHFYNVLLPDEKQRLYQSAPYPRSPV